MRVLITGVTGFAGRHLAEHCCAHGATVVGLGRSTAPDPELSGHLDDFLEVDLRDSGKTMEAVRGAAPDRIFHLAAEASVARSWDDPTHVMHGNLFTALPVLEATRRAAPNARLLVACSGEEYGEPESLPVEEEHRLRPQNPYALSKATVDLAAGFYSDAHDTFVVRTRAFNHTGPGQSADYVVASFARQIAQAEAEGREAGELVVTTGNVDVRRDFTDVRDVVRAYWLALEECPAGVYNVCSGRATAIREILDGLAAETSLEVRQRTDPKLLREHDVMEITGSHDKLTEACGWRPEIPLAETLRDTLDWWRARLEAEVPT
jgi:GDP-4-dehydro-6-deoxy-D-mannose reductase